jgi:tetratricopeptide (TPR) repeat protein
MRASIRYWMMISLTQIGEFDTGRRLANESLREGKTLGDPLAAQSVFTYIGLGKLEIGAGDLEAAIRAYESASAAYRDDFHGDLRYPICWGLGLAYALAGRADDGLTLFEKAEAAQRAVNSNVFPSVRMLHYGLALLATGRVEEGRRVANEALGFARERGNRPSEAGAHGLLAEVARLQIRHAAMEHHVREALRLAELLEMRPLAARCHLRLASLYERTGGPEAEYHGAAARSLLEKMGGRVNVDAAGIH